jgi:proline iminopeptidase
MAQGAQREQGKEQVVRSGFVAVGDGHELYFEEWGNPSGVPVLVLHGGPGNAFNETHKRLFNAKKHRVILFDQRGTGRSTPAGTITNNTTVDLVNDINRVRTMTGLHGPTNIAGGSWGSTLALVYAEAYPENVKELMLWSTFLATAKEILDPLGRQPMDPSAPHPGMWKKFIAHIPREFRNDPQKILDYCLSVLNSMDPIKAWDLAVAYTVYDTATCNSPEFDEEKVRAEAQGDFGVIGARRIQLYYFKHRCFLTENQILQNIGRIRNIKASVCHGLDDWCTRPRVSTELKRAYGDRMTLKFVKSGHLRSDPELARALQEISNQLT